MRVVVTGHDVAGAARFVRDEVVAAVPFPGTGVLRRIWSADGPATFPDPGADPAAPGFFPPVGGMRVSQVVLRPTEQAKAVGGEPEDVAPGLSATMDPANAGMHVTDTVDVVFVVSGTVRLEVGTDVTVLQAGDLLVQNGTRHRWTNTGPVDAELLLFLVGARRAGQQCQQ